MGVKKHGKDSAGAKACKRYKETGRLIANKAKKAERVEKATAAGKHYRNAKRTLKPSVVGEENYRMIKIDIAIENLNVQKPYYSPILGKILWGATEEPKRRRRHNNGNKRGDKK